MRLRRGNAIATIGLMGLLLLNLVLAHTIIAQQNMCEAVNRSYSTTCAEEDNVNVPIFPVSSFPGVSPYQIVATHPTFIHLIQPSTNNCAPDFTGCRLSYDFKLAQGDACFNSPENKLYDDGINAIWGCFEPAWWRGLSMRMVVGSRERDGHRLVWIRKIADQNSYPQVFILYEDGNMRLKPHPPRHLPDVCFGSSVIIGPAAPAQRPYVDIQRVQVDPVAMSLNVTFRSTDNTVRSALINLLVNRSRTIAQVMVSPDDAPAIPIATFRSMWVSDGNADVDHIQNQDSDLPILGNWARLKSPLLFYRGSLSRHNTSAPDIRIDCGKSCTPDMFIEYDDLVGCSQASSQDTNTFRFAGNAGDRIAIQAIRRDGSFDGCIELFAPPDNTPVNRMCSLGSAQLNATLNRTGVHRIVITDSHNFTVYYSLILRCLDGSCSPQLTNVSAASYVPSASIAKESIVAAFGAQLATTTATATGLPLPTSLAGTTVRVKDNTTTERLAPLFFVSPGQINYQVPMGTASGAATVSVTSGNGSSSFGNIMITPVVPSLFAANANGQGVPAAVAFRTSTQRFEPVARFDQSQNRFVAVPIDLGPEGDQVFLVLFGTGIRFHGGLPAVITKIGGVDGQVTFAGAVPEFVGLDQVNTRIPRSLIGRGEVEVVLIAEGKMANPVRVNIK